MTDIAALAASASRIAATYRKCSNEQALVYACEDVVDSELGSRAIPATDARHWFERACEAEDVDPPEVINASRIGSVRASVDLDARVVCIRRSRTTVSTLVHELAHLTCGADSHREAFRTELIRLTRVHVSVDHAALLHALFVATGLDVAPWRTAPTRR